MSKISPKKSNPERPNGPLIALIGAGATVIAALISGIFATLPARQRADIAPAPVMSAASTPVVETPTVLPANTPLPPTQTPAPNQPAVEIRGPRNAPLGERTAYTIISQNAIRAVWSIGGFADNQRMEVDDLGPSHQIVVEPTNADRVGDIFTIVVTVYSRDGQSATASKDFFVVDEPS